MVPDQLPCVARSTLPVSQSPEYAQKAPLGQVRWATSAEAGTDIATDAASAPAAARIPTLRRDMTVPPEAVPWRTEHRGERDLRSLAVLPAASPIFDGRFTETHHFDPERKAGQATAHGQGIPQEGIHPPH